MKIAAYYLGLASGFSLGVAAAHIWTATRNSLRGTR